MSLGEIAIWLAAGGIAVGSGIVLGLCIGRWDEARKRARGDK